MATPPARVLPQPLTGLNLPEASQDTERPPPPTPPSDNEMTDADAGARLQFTPEPASGVTGTTTPDPGESTKIGRPPDPAAIAPRNLHAAPPAMQPPRATLGVGAPKPTPLMQAAMPLNPNPTPATPRVGSAVGMPFPSARGPAPETARAAPNAMKPMPAEGTAIGIAPIQNLAPPPAPPATALPPVSGAPFTTSLGQPPAPPTVQSPQRDRVSTRELNAMKADRPLTRRCTSCNELYPDDFLVCPRDATPLVAAEAQTVDDPLVGSLIGETYQIVRTIGEGGMGRVYEARHLRLKERRFAVKCLHADLAKNPEMAARFLREAESASSIKHNNVVDVFDVHHLPDGTPYLVGEFLEGEELADYVQKRGPLDPRAAAKVARQVCNALGAAHARGIVHRDMKPENIFVLQTSINAVDHGESRTLQVKVLDFGISKAGHGDTSHLTKTGVIMGTPSYMSPEQARGRPVDHRADVYSVGACLYFMVTGRRPFDSDDPTSTLSMVLTEDPVRPREIDQRIPEMLELIIQRAMAKDVNDRYASMAELEKALAVFTGKSSLLVPSGQSMLPHTIPTPQDAMQVSGAARAFDVAKAIIGGGAHATPPQQTGNLAKTARPIIIITSATLGAWLVGGTVAALAGLVRVLHDGEITLTESLLLVVGCLFAGATPIALYVMHLRRVIWPNSVRALQLATDLKRMTTAALVTYGGVSIIGRIVHTVFWRSSRGLASGLWDIMLFVLSLAVALTLGGFTPFLRNLRSRRRAD